MRERLTFHFELRNRSGNFRFFFFFFFFFFSQCILQPQPTEQSMCGVKCILTHIKLQPNWLGLQNIPTASLQRGMTALNKCPGYNIKQSDGEAPVLVLWGTLSGPSLPLLLGPLWARVVVLDRVLSVGQIGQFDIETVFKQMTYIKLNCFK